jgi:hypothetical protein
MKLYTEEEVFKAIQMADKYHYLITSEECDIINSLTPIELPSDEEIDNHIEDDFLNSTEVHKYAEEAQLMMKAMCKAGALWMRDKLQGGNNEQ